VTLKKLKLGILAICLLCLLGVLLGYQVVLQMGNYLVVRDPLKPADAVAVLSGGGPERVEYASYLITKKYGKKLIFTDTGEENPLGSGTVNDTMAKQAADEGVRRSKQYFAGDDVASTVDEARAVLKLAKHKGWESIIVVTDTFHSRRTKVIFSDVFKGSGIIVRSNPVDVKDYWYDAAHWWKDSNSVKATLTEYASLVAYLIGLYH
jgi:uncharacterized SAM-binding protein YcdF (DUF218 family)